MSFVKKVFSSVFGGGSVPQVAPVIIPPTNADAASAGDAALRESTARGRAATILTSELGVGGNDPSKRKKLGVA